MKRRQRVQPKDVQADEWAFVQQVARRKLRLHKCSASERRFALRMLRRAVTLGNRLHAEAVRRDGSADDLGAFHQLALWRLLVMASHKSGRL